jgi:hypothetical protein
MLDRLVGREPHAGEDRRETGQAGQAEPIENDRREGHGREEPGGDSGK